jgi:heterodisulfide reductase subunit B
MKFRDWMGAAAVCAILSWPSSAASESEACAAAKREVEQAQQALSEATRNADAKAAAYNGCVEKRGHEACGKEKREFDKALKAKREARAAYNFAVEKKKQACG